MRQESGDRLAGDLAEAALLLLDAHATRIEARLRVTRSGGRVRAVPTARPED